MAVGLLTAGQTCVGGGGAAGVVPGGGDPRHGPLPAVRVTVPSLLRRPPFLRLFLLPLCGGRWGIVCKKQRVELDNDKMHCSLSVLLPPRSSVFPSLLFPPLLPLCGREMMRV